MGRPPAAGRLSSTCGGPPFFVPEVLGSAKWLTKQFHRAERHSEQGVSGCRSRGWKAKREVRAEGTGLVWLGMGEIRNQVWQVLCDKDQPHSPWSKMYSETQKASRQPLASQYTPALATEMGVDRKLLWRGAGEERDYAEGWGGRVNWRVRV